jgi:hypothetical protein
MTLDYRTTNLRKEMAMTSRKNGSNTDARNTDGTFAPGNGGKPKGARHRTTLAVEALLEGQAEALTQAAIDRALAGDTTAQRICLDRIAPTRKDAPISFDMPKVETAADASVVATAILRSVSAGELTPMEGATVMGLLEGYRRAIETTEFEERLAALETEK